MTKYCDKCGKPLPEGVEICPECSAAADKEDEAALFTRMTAETEVWKSVEPVKPARPAKVRGSRKKLILSGCAAVLLALAVLLILFIQPGARVVRALNKGEVERAYEIYWQSRLPSGERVEKIDRALLKTAEKLCSQYANHEIDADTAASRLSILGGFGDGAAELLEPTYAEFRSYNSSQIRMDAAEALFADGEFLEARDAYLAVDENDANYPAAQEKAAECLVRYGVSVGEAADALMAENRFPEAAEVLKAGNDILYGFGTFSEVIDSKILECNDRYEQFILNEAKALADLEDYDAALKRIRSGMAEFSNEKEKLVKAEADYALQARDKHIADAKTRSDGFYEAGEPALAFEELDNLKAAAEENEEGADALIVALEERYGTDTRNAAEEAYAGERDNLPDAIAILDAALEVRELEDVRTYRDELAQYLPLWLAEAEYYAKSGTVFRNDGIFESLDGTKFCGGWVWGENGAEISFALDGAYDEFYCAFAMRRDDNADANGRFELWCDGKRVLESEKLFHFQKDPKYYYVDISGCKELKLVFICDYKVSTAENGYCYHGLCDLRVTKNIDTAPTAD